MLKAFVSSEDFESIDEAIKPFYASSEDGYALQVEASDGWALENIDGLKSSLQKERKLRSSFEKQAKELATRYSDIDIEEYKSAMEKLEEMSSFNPEMEAEKLAAQKLDTQKKKIESAIAKQWEAKFEAEHTPLLAKYNKIEAQLKDQMIRGAALQAIAENDGDVDLLLPHVVSKMKFDMTEDGFTTELVDKGEPLYNNRGEPLSPSEYVGSILKEKFPAAFASKSRAGGGKPPENGSKKPEVSLGEKIARLQPGQSLF